MTYRNNIIKITNKIMIIFTKSKKSCQKILFNYLYYKLYYL